MRSPTDRIFVVATTLSPRERADAAQVDRARQRLSLQLDQLTTAAGFVVQSVTWSSDPPTAWASGVLLRLEARVEPRTDGEWPSIHAAVEQDAADRDRARRDRDGVLGRLEALRASTDWWADAALRGR